MKYRYLNFPAIFLLLVACTPFVERSFEKRYGTAEPCQRVVTQLAPADVDYWTDVKPVPENRCVVCHACYDAPCQLKLSSIEGIERGGSPEVVYQHRV